MYSTHSFIQPTLTVCISGHISVPARAVLPCAARIILCPLRFPIAGLVQRYLYFIAGSKVRRYRRSPVLEVG